MVQSYSRALGTLSMARWTEVNKVACVLVVLALFANCHGTNSALTGTQFGGLPISTLAYTLKVWGWFSSF